MGNTTIRDYLKDKNYCIPSSDVYAHISSWLEWYQGEVKKFHSYTVYNGISSTKEKRHRLSMAKKLCEDWANLLLNEKVVIKSGSFDTRMNEILEKNNFRTRASQLVELTFALGTGAFVEYKDSSGEPIIDYIRADMIYPISWDNGDVTECAFGSYRVYDGAECIYLQIHRIGNPDDGENPNLYYIENKYVAVDTGVEKEPPDSVIPIVSTGSQEPLFQILMPNAVNNIELDSPMGVSVFGNAVPQLKGCDIVYDSYINEYVLGRKRLLVPVTMAKQQMQKDGVTAPVFDPNDTVYYAIPADKDNGIKLTEVDMNIRASDHELGMQRCLDLLSFMCGLGTGRYQFNGGSVKTATEVISDKSDLFQNLKKHEIPLRDALIKMIKAIAFLDGKSIEKVTVDLDDSVIEDKAAERKQDITDIGIGVMTKVEYRMKWYGESKEIAAGNVVEEPEPDEEGYLDTEGT